MKLTILKVILWPKDTDLPPRVIRFEPGKINIISGENGTGKSTITWIIDYCLGSDKCSIPVGLIRDVTEWFGLHLRLANTEMIVARHNPGDQQSTNELYWEEGLELTVPAVITTKNARVEDLKFRFNQICQLPALDFASGENSGFGGAPSFRDMASFNFQPQHIVANPYTFFYKADTTGNREKLKISFPLVLGAVTSETLAAQRELRDLEREHERLKRELDARLNAAHAWESEVETYYLQARGLGLIPQTATQIDGWALDRYIEQLRQIPETIRSMDIPDVREGTNEAAAVDITRVIGEEDRLAQETGAIRRRLEKVEQLSSAISQYDSDLSGQEDRLGAVGWLAGRLDDDHTCPVCGADHKSGNIQLTGLKVLAHEMSTLSASIHQAPAKLDEQLADLRKELREKEAALSKARQMRKTLEADSTALAAQRQRVRQIYLFVGRVEQALENLSSSTNVDDLRGQVEGLARRVAQLRRQLDPNGQRDRLNAAINRVSQEIAYYAGLLHLEHASENVGLNVRDLTLQFKPLSGRTDFLWEVGSGQNWVGYHIAGMLALHQHFAAVTNNPVPNFLVIDQPSQVYFPEAWPSLDQVPEKIDNPDLSPDILGVRRIFKVLSDFIKVMDESFQIIVTEHAGSITWRELPYVNVVGNWRKGKDEFLVPQEWISNA